jgi:hypothetical protein
MQTVVLDNPLAGSVGDIADHWTATNGDIVSGTSEEASAGIPFGVMVGKGAGRDGALLLAANDDVLKGIAVRAHSYATPQEMIALAAPAGALGLAPGVTFGVGRTGRYRVLIENDVAIGDPVHVRAVATAGEVAGAFREVDDGTDTINCSDFCSWVEGGEVDADTGFGFAVLEVNMGLAPLATADS